MDGNKYFKFTKDLAIAVHDELASLVGVQAWACWWVIQLVTRRVLHELA